MLLPEITATSDCHSHVVLPCDGKMTLVYTMFQKVIADVNPVKRKLGIRHTQVKLVFGTGK
jgi:hypothetical protein